MRLNRLQEAIRRLHNDEDFKQLKKNLEDTHSKRLEDLENANDALQAHKLQGYCQALRDVLRLSTPKD